MYRSSLSVSSIKSQSATMRILILCTGNRCRSQMAHGILKYLCPSIEVHSAGVRPATEVHPLAIQVMSEIGIDISQHYPKSVDQYLNQTWNYVITVCGGHERTALYLMVLLPIGFISVLTTLMPSPVRQKNY